MMLNVFRQILIWLLIVAAVSLAVDYLRRPALPQNFSSMPLQTLDGRTVDLAAMSHERPLLLYVWATWCGVCRYTTPSVATLANDGGNVMTVALRSGDNAALARWLAHKKMVGGAGHADPYRYLARRGEVSHHRLDQRLGDAPAAVAGVVAHFPACAALSRARDGVR